MRKVLDYFWLFLLVIFSPIYYPVAMEMVDSWWATTILSTCFLLVMVLGILLTDEVLKNVREKNNENS